MIAACPHIRRSTYPARRSALTSTAVSRHDRFRADYRHLMNSIRTCRDVASLEVRKQHLDLLVEFAGDPHWTASSAYPDVKPHLASSKFHRAKVAQGQFVDPASGGAALL